ncbi:N-(5'-phosphoribosyl)anthranilate isomerase [Actibacterium sp. D379-3]
MTYMRPIHANEIWLSQIFAAKSAASGGVVRRKIVDVERKIGRQRLELEVRKRGFHMIECGAQFVIICDPAELKVIC